MPADDVKYEIGYRKPPRNGQFAKGRSGNPNGRRKGTKNFATVIQDELRARVDITENGKRRSISKREAVAKQLVNKAAGGDPKAIPVLLNETRPHETAASTEKGQDEVTLAEEQMVMANIVARILRNHADSQALGDDPKRSDLPDHKINEDSHDDAQ